LQAYHAHWPKPDVVVEVVSHFEEQLGEMTGTEIILEIDSNQIFPPAQGSGYPMMVALGMVLGVMTIGLILPPYLIVDEKETHTLDALLISPARTTHLLIGKSIVGLFYSLTASMLIFVLSWRWIVHWDIVLLAIILGGLSAVSVGLLVGILFDTPTNVNMVVGMLLAVFLMPMYLWTSLAPKMTPLLQSAISTLPSIAMYKLVRLSFTETSKLSVLSINAIILTAWIFVILILVAWRIRRLDR
jgi:ABC-2 type transport system permease protein